MHVGRFVAITTLFFGAHFLAAQATFSSQRIYQTGLNPQSIVSDDFDKDGIKDIVVAAYDDRQVALHRGLADGTFDTAGTRYNTNGFPKKLIVADINKDGFPDVVVLEDAANTENPQCPSQAGFEIYFGGPNGFSPPDSFCPGSEN